MKAVFRFFARATIFAVGISLLAACGGTAKPKKAGPTGSLTVEVVQPEIYHWAERLSANGALAPWQEAVISAETGSLRITSLQADVGDIVKKGQLLATLSRESVQAEQTRLQATVAQAKANLELARADARRAETIGGSGAMSTQDLDSYRIKALTAEADLAAAEAALHSNAIQLQQTDIRAVDDGVITSRSALLGNVVSAGTELFRLLRQNRVEWQAELDARQLARVAVGQTVTLTLPDGQNVSGKVRQVAPTLNDATSRALVYVALPDNSPARPGMYASGHIELTSSDALTIPDTALVMRDGRANVFTLSDDNHVIRTIVSVGRQQEGRLEITTGLPANARVVASGGAFLSDGAQVNVAKAAEKRP